MPGGMLRPSAVSADPSIAAFRSWEARNVATNSVRYRGRRAVRIIGSAGDDVVDKLVIIPVTASNGTVEIDAASAPEPGQPADARSYFGIALRGNVDFSRFESLYVRPENARSEDQLRRNRSTQYIEFPSRPWQKLRREFPGKYESYAALQPGEWTRLRVDVLGRTAKLYVNDATDPALVVTDLVPAGDADSGIALWIGNRTIAYVARIQVSPR